MSGTVPEQMVRAGLWESQLSRASEEAATLCSSLGSVSSPAQLLPCHPTMRDCDPEVEDETSLLLPCAASDQSGFPQQQQGQAREHTLRVTENATPMPGSNDKIKTLQVFQESVS